MKTLTENPVTRMSQVLMALCRENGVIDPNIENYSESEDLLEGGLLDSMGLVYMQAIIEEEFAVNLAPELFITELRNIRSIASYLAESMAQTQMESVAIS